MNFSSFWFKLQGRKGLKSIQQLASKQGFVNYSGLRSTSKNVQIASEVVLLVCCVHCFVLLDVK